MPQRARAPSTQSAETEFDYGQLLRGVLRRRKGVVMAAFVLIAVPLFGWSIYGRERLFQSTATLHIRPSIAEMFPGARELALRQDLSVQMAVLKSRRLAKEVLESVPLETVEELIKQNPGSDYLLPLANAARRLLGKPPIPTSPRERAIFELQEARMTFRAPNREDGRTPTGLIEISATASKPRVAMDLVSTYIQVLVNWSRRSEQEDVAATQKFLEAQLSRVRTELKESEAALRQFEEQHGVVRLPEQTHIRMSRLVELQGNLAQVQANQEVARSKLDALQKALEHSSANPPMSSDARITEEAAKRISARLTQLESTLIEMRAKYTEEHPSLIAVREEIQNLRSQLAQLPVGSLPSSGANEGAMGRDEIQRNIATIKADVTTLRTQEQALRPQIDQLRKALQSLSGREFESTRLLSSVESNRTLLSFLSEKFLALRVRGQSQGDIVKVIDPPILPSSPIEGLSPRQLALLILFTVGSAVGLGFLIEHIHEPVESEKTIQNRVGLPFLGSALAVPSPRPRADGGPFVSALTILSRPPKGDGRPLVVSNEARKAALPQEFYRGIRTNLEAVNIQSACKAIMITSALPGEGKSTTAINLAVTLRELGRRVALVDADLRQPGLSRILRSKVQGGFSNLLKETRNVKDLTLAGDTSLHGIGTQSGSDFLFIPSGDPPKDPAALLGSTRARELVAWFKKHWDYVLFDSPPVLLVSDNILLARSLDGVILVAHAGRTRRRDLQRAKIILEEVGARILGVILNQVSPGLIPYYHSRYRYYYGPDARRH